MKKTFTTIILFTIVITLLSSCTSSFLSHRIYGNRFYVKSDKTQTINHEFLNREQSKILNTPTLSASLEIDPYINIINFISEPTCEVIAYHSYETPNNQPVSEPTCDDIILKEGKIIKSKVLEITDTDVKYKLCDHLEGPTYNVKKSDVLLIKYSNGKEEQFTTSNNNQGRKSFEEELIMVGVIGLGLLAFYSLLYIVYPDFFAF
jgi:hypothetical protein